MNIQLDGALTAALATSIFGLATAVVIFVAGELVRAWNARQDRRRQVAERILDAIDSFLRVETSPLIAKPWQKANINLMLAKNRLLMDIPKNETDLWFWMSARVDELLAGKSSVQRAEIGGALAGEITQWYRGERKAKWFAKQNSARRKRS